jgi:hypothetical protein
VLSLRAAEGLLSVRCFEPKENSEIMPQQKYGKLMTDFQQIFAAFRVLMAEIGILLFFPKIASKSPLLLIMTRGVLSLCAADTLAVLQTESKGNFCLITVSTHKTFCQPQAIGTKKQTLSNHSALFPCEAGRPAVTSRL